MLRRRDGRNAEAEGVRDEVGYRVVSAFKYLAEALCLFNARIATFYKACYKIISKLKIKSYLI